MKAASIDKPVPVRLGDLKPLLQQEAKEKEWSMNKLILKIIGKHYSVDKKEKK